MLEFVTQSKCWPIWRTIGNRYLVKMRNKPNIWEKFNNILIAFIQELLLHKYFKSKWSISALDLPSPVMDTIKHNSSFVSKVAWNIVIFLGILSELILSICYFQFLVQYLLNSVICEICSSFLIFHFLYCRTHKMHFCWHQSYLIALVIVHNSLPSDDKGPACFL